MHTKKSRFKAARVRNTNQSTIKLNPLSMDKVSNILVSQILGANFLRILE